MKTIKSILMERDNLTSSEADELISEAKSELESCLRIGDLMRADDICMLYFQLEPDYMDELLF